MSMSIAIDNDNYKKKNNKKFNDNWVVKMQLKFLNIELRRIKLE